jgi:hypothetical protein
VVVAQHSAASRGGQVEHAVDVQASVVPETEAEAADAARLEALLQHSAVGLPVCTWEVPASWRRDRCYRWMGDAMPDRAIKKWAT